MTVEAPESISAPNSPPVERAKVVVIGGGPAGLSAAATLASAGHHPVVVLEREAEFGGIPRHCDHTGFGLRLWKRSLRGPKYATRMFDMAERAGVQLRHMHTVTGWVGSHALDVTSPSGRVLIEAEAIVVATGARERSRSARFIPGDRVAGVYTTAQLQQMSHMQHRPVGTRAVVVGSELISWSAVSTLRSAGCHPVLMVSDKPKSETPGWLAMLGSVRFGLPCALGVRVTRIIGSQRVEAVELLDLKTNHREIFPCDTVILTGDWVPEHEVIRLGGLALDPFTRGALVDGLLRTDRPGVYAAGNVIHPVDTADVAALDGLHVAQSVHRQLTGGQPLPYGVRIVPGGALSWVTPGWVNPADPNLALQRMIAWGHQRIRFPKVVIRQGGQVVKSARVWRALIPGRAFRIPVRVLQGINPAAGDLEISVQ